ncbi:MAG: hypothetical protein KF760_25220 [Candidatus Eremiobacteraeota bacterium]|nr:hypothetical protein [Candidatus Eremiobacteraeota bacterium]
MPRLSLQSYNLRVDLEVVDGQWRDQVFTREEDEPTAWAVWRDRPAYLVGQQVTVCGWVHPPPAQRFLTCELLGQQGRVDLTPEGAFLLRFAAPTRPARLKLASAASSREVPLLVTAARADFRHDGPTLRIHAPALAGQSAELQLQRLPIDSSLNGAYDDFEFVAAEPARAQVRETFDAQGRLSVQCNSKAAGIFEVSGTVGETRLYHRWLHLPEGGRVGRRFCRTLDAFDQVTLSRFGQPVKDIERADLRGGSEDPALGMDLDPPGPFRPGEEAVLRIALNGSPWGVGFLCWSEGSRLISWGIVSLSEGLNGLRAQIPTDSRWERLSLSLHLLAPGRRLQARLGVLLRPGIRFTREWSERLTLRLTDDQAEALPNTTVLGRIVSTPWAERQQGWWFEPPFQVLPAEPPAGPAGREPECAAGSAPTWTFLGRTDGEGKVVWAAPHTPGMTVHVSARDARGAWWEAYFEA